MAAILKAFKEIIPEDCMTRYFIKPQTPEGNVGGVFTEYVVCRAGDDFLIEERHDGRPRMNHWLKDDRIVSRRPFILNF